MEREELNILISTHFNKCVRLGQALQGNYDPEGIHAFRVESKRLRALLRLSCAGRKKKASLPANLGVLYKMAGVLRNVHIQHRSMAEAALRLGRALPARCESVLNDRLHTAVLMMDISYGMADALSLRRWPKDFAKCMYGPRPATGQFLSSKMADISSLVSGGIPDDEQLHTIRKTMKDLLYAWPCFSRHDLSDAIAAGMLSRTQLNNCAAELGDLHDIMINLELLKDKDLLNGGDPAAEAFLEAAGKQWMDDADAMRKRIVRLWLTGSRTMRVISDSEGLEVRENPVAAMNLKTSSYELHVD